MLSVLYVLAGVVNFGCLLYVVFNMFEEDGAMHAFLGLCCCQIYAYIWGWLKLDKDVKMKVMILWTLANVVQGVLTVMYPEQFGRDRLQ